MAELIPLEYRARVARQCLISRWMTVGIVTAAIAAAALISAYLWKQRQSACYVLLERQYREAEVHIKDFNDLQAQRDQLAQRMRKMEDLQTDHVLLSLLQGVSTAFSDSDCLEYICVDAYPADPKNNASKYTVRVRGFTTDDTTHARLLDRLTDMGRQSEPPLHVPLGEKHLLLMLDGQVTSFDIICDQPVAKGG